MAEENEGAEKPQSVSIEDIEAAARQQGWDPEKGDLGPLEFLARGREFRDRMYEQIKDLRQDNERVYKIVAEHITGQKKKEHDAEVQDIQAQIRKAAEDGDADRVVELTNKLPKEPPKEPDEPQTDPVTQKWLENNPWFNENPEMQTDAVGFYNAEMRKLGRDDPSVILPKVDERMKKLHPDYFTPENPNKNRGAGAEKGGKHKPGKKEGLTRDDLTEDEAAHFDQFVKLGMSEDKLLRSIENGRAQRGQ